jgi:lysophospholipase L1-like esterase
LPVEAASTSIRTPRVMASTGDSITRAFNVGWCCVLADSPSRSWSTGASTSVHSHYRRLIAIDPRLLGHAYNDAASGARMRDLAGQLARAAAQRADYVTIEMGANDVCTSSAATMTTVTDFEAQFRAAMRQFTETRPRARILVASIPDIYRLWTLFHDNPVATLTWSTFGICPSMLRPTNTETLRQQARAREMAFNEVLGRVCSEFSRCRWDNGAVFNNQYAPADVSTVDYFHPSVRGQNTLAAVTWAAGYWPDA